MKAKSVSNVKDKRGKTKAIKTITQKNNSASAALVHPIPSDQIGNILERVSDGFVALDANMNYTYVNQRGGERLGRKPEDLIGKNYWKEYPEAKGTPFANACARALETKETIVLENYYAPLDRWFENRIHPSKDGLVVFFTDITERKHVEAELHLSRDRLAELSRRLVEAHENEQRAIGRELHDQFGQILTALKLTLELAPQLPPEPAAKKFAQALELVDELLNRVSHLSLELRPPVLDDLGLVPALLWHINRYQEQTNIAVDFKHSGAEGKRFDPEVETTAYRIVQESLTNVARHSHATRARLEVRVSGERMEIRIGDNGIGFDPQAALALHRGLGGMRERVNLLGGSFQIESQPGAGTKKFFQLPLSEKTT